jgi:hypothetical protein
LRLWRNESRSERVHFMDGPYAVEVCKGQRGKLRLTMFAGPNGGREVAVGEADATQFIADLAAQAKKSSMSANYAIGGRRMLKPFSREWRLWIMRSPVEPR